MQMLGARNTHPAFSAVTINGDPTKHFPRRVAIYGDLPNQIHEFQRHDELISTERANLPTEVKMASSCGV